jgi:hypothetical protein
MSLLVFEGFDVSDVPSPPWSTTTGGTATRATPGRNSTSHRIDTGGNYTRLLLSANYATLIVGCAMYRPGTVTTDDILWFEDHLTSVAHLTVQMRSDGAIRVYRGGGDSGTNLGESATGLITANTWFHLEFKATIDDTAGIAVVRINGITALSLSSLDTRNGGGAYVNRIGFGGIDGISTLYVDDVYVCDTTGTYNNDFIGDASVVALYPDGAGQYSEWTPSAGSNWQNVDEQGTPNDDTDYNSAGDVNTRDLYNMTPLPITSGAVHGVKIDGTLKKTDTGTRGVKLMMRNGTTETESSEFPLNTAYTRHESIVYETNPHTSAPFTIAEVNAIQMGQKVST